MLSVCKDCKTVLVIPYQQLIVQSKLMHNGNFSIEDVCLVVGETRRRETSDIFIFPSFTFNFTFT